jgi:hypothetical protein
MLSTSPVDTVSFTTIAHICELKLKLRICRKPKTRSFYFSNQECPVCEGKLTADTQQKPTFRPREQQHGEENLKLQLVAINQALQELKNLMMIQKEEQCKMSQTVE